MAGWRRSGEQTHPASQVLAGWRRGWGEGALYLVGQRAEVLEAPKAGVAQADQDGEQHDQEGKQGGRGRQTWGTRGTSLREGRGRGCLHLRPQGTEGATPGTGTAGDCALRQTTDAPPPPPQAAQTVSSQPAAQGPLSSRHCVRSDFRHREAQLVAVCQLPHWVSSVRPPVSWVGGGVEAPAAGWGRVTPLSCFFLFPKRVGFPSCRSP